MVLSWSGRGPSIKEIYEECKKCDFKVVSDSVFDADSNGAGLVVVRPPEVGVIATRKCFFPKCRGEMC